MADLERGRFRGALLGLAIGDAIGATVEFLARGTFEPLTDMIGGGPFALEAGRWTDDTSWRSVSPKACSPQTARI